MTSSDTRRRMVETAVTLFQRNGYRGTSWRTLVNAGATPWGSVHHHFPGGKEELGVAAVELGGELVDALIVQCLQTGRSPADGIRRWFWTSADLFERSGFHDGCPVAPVALETAPDSPALTRACRAALDRWTRTLTAALETAGITPMAASSIGTTVVAGFEGAMILARVHRSTEPLLRAGELLAQMIEGHAAGPVTSA